MQTLELSMKRPVARVTGASSGIPLVRAGVQVAVHRLPAEVVAQIAEAARG